MWTPRVSLFHTGNRLLKAKGVTVCCLVRQLVFVQSYGVWGIPFGGLGFQQLRATRESSYRFRVSLCECYCLLRCTPPKKYTTTYCTHNTSAVISPDAMTIFGRIKLGKNKQTVFVGINAGCL